MGYMHIDNLYKNQDVMLFKECYALEKLHGTSANFHYDDGVLTFFSGGEKHDKFVALFDQQKLLDALARVDRRVKVFGEAYGGKCQGMSGTYGKDLKFCAFDVKVGDYWLSVPQAHELVAGLGLEFVHYVKIPTTLDAIDAERDADSVQAVRNGIGPGKKREGIVLRPPIEVTKNNGDRVVCKHKRDDFAERATPQKVVSPEALAVLTAAEAIASEWVVPMRLTHVLQKFPADVGPERTQDVINAMLEDVLREAKGEIVDSKEARRAIGKKTAELFKGHIKGRLRVQAEVDKVSEVASEGDAVMMNGEQLAHVLRQVSEGAGEEVKAEPAAASGS